MTRAVDLGRKATKQRNKSYRLVKIGGVKGREPGCVYTSTDAILYTTPILMRRVVRVDKIICKLLPWFVQEGLEGVWRQ